MMRFHKLAITLVLPLAAAGLAACSSSKSDTAKSSSSSVPISAGTQGLYAAAKKEGTLTWYTSLDPTTSQATVDAFKKAYPGVGINFVRLTSGQLATRYSQERSAGSSPAAVLTIASTTFISAATTKGWLNTSPTLPDLASWPSAYYKGGVARVGIVTLGVGYNTELVGAADVPKAWTDVLKPTFSGKIIFGDPRTVPAYMDLAQLLKQQVSPDFLTSLAKQKFTVVASVVPGNQTLASGGSKLLFPETDQLVAELTSKGAPIAIAHPSPTTGIEFATAVTAGGSHQNSAQLFMDFQLTTAGQAAINGNYGSSPLGNVGGHSLTLPSDYVSANDPAAAAQKSTLLSELGIQ